VLSVEYSKRLFFVNSDDDTPNIYSRSTPYCTKQATKWCFLNREEWGGNDERTYPIFLNFREMLGSMMARFQTLGILVLSST
jgi:hypothetical protein